MLSKGLWEPDVCQVTTGGNSSVKQQTQLQKAALHLPAPQQGFARAQQLPDCVVTCICQVLAIQLILHSKQALLQHDGRPMVCKQNGVDWPMLHSDACSAMLHDNGRMTLSEGQHTLVLRYV